MMSTDNTSKFEVKHLKKQKRKKEKHNSKGEYMIIFAFNDFS